MKNQFRMIFALLFTLAVVPLAQAGPRVPLMVVEDQGVSRHGETATGGIPFPQGAVFDPDTLVVRDAAGSTIPSQAHQLGISWPDGSLKWVLLQFQADVAARQTARYELAVKKAKKCPPPPGRIEIREEPDRVEVTTGPLRFTVSREDCRLPNQVWVDDKLVIKDGARLEFIADRESMTPEEFKASGRDPYELSTFGIGDRGGLVWNAKDNTTAFKNIVWNKITPGLDYSTCLTGKVNITVEESGPLRCVLRLEKAGEKREGQIGFVARLYAYAGKKQLRIELTVENYEQFIPIPAQPYFSAIVNVKHIRRFTYRLQPLSGPAQRVEFGADGDSIQLKTLQSASVRQLQGNLWTLTRTDGGQRESGARSPGWLCVYHGGQRIALAGKYFWETWPKGVAYDHASGALTLELWPAEAPAPGYPLAAGRERTCEFVVAFDMPGEEVSAMARAELRPYPAPEYVAASGAAHRFVPLDDPRFSRYASYVKKTTERQVGRRLYGDIEFGDQYSHNPNLRWNNYHDVGHEWFMFYLASAKPDFFRFAEAVVQHTLDVDTQHWGYEVGAREAEFGRPEDHVCIGPIQGGIKVWNFSDVDYYFLTGKRRVLETLEQTAGFLRHCGGMVPGGFTHGRATSLPFMHLAYMYEAIGDERAVAQRFPKAYSPKRIYPQRRDSSGLETSAAILQRLTELSLYLCDSMATKQYEGKSFMVSYVAEGLYRYWSLTGDPRAAQGIVDTAHYLYRDLVLPTGLPFYSVSPPETPFSPFQPMWDEVDLPATRAYQVTHDRKFLEYGRASVDWILNYRGIANEYTGFGSTIPAFLWAMREAGFTQRDLAKMRRDIDYEKALPQTKAIALAKHGLAPSGESRAYCMLAEEVGRVLINLGRYDEALAWFQHWQSNPQTYDLQPFIERAKALQKDASLR